jgi:hypothetical protein
MHQALYKQHKIPEVLSSYLGDGNPEHETRDNEQTSFDKKVDCFFDGGDRDDA